MSFFKSIIKYFTEEPKKEVLLPSEQAKLAKKNEETQQTVLKSLFTKTDPHSITKFPYIFTKEFFPPLDQREKAYMSKEIIRWHSIFLEVAFDDIVELIMFYIEKNTAFKDVLDYSKKFRNEFEFILIEMLHLHYMNVVVDRINNLSEVKLLKWQPVAGENSYEPESEEYMHIIEKMTEKITVEVRTQIKLFKEQEMLIQQIKNSNESGVRQNSLTEHIKINLTKNNRAIVKNAFDRLIYENSLFPSYEGDYERPFNNDLFLKYCQAFEDEEGNEMTFYKVMEKVNKDMSQFLSKKSKDDLLAWVYKVQWPEFENFMMQEYQDISDEDIENLKAQNFSMYKLSLDFFAIILFSIYLDGIPIPQVTKKDKKGW